MHYVLETEMLSLIERALSDWSGSDGDTEITAGAEACAGS